MSERIGLIGKKINSTYSKAIYNGLFKEKYENININSLEELDSFFKEKKFNFVNVTMPYKKEVLKYLDYKSPNVIDTGVCNLVVNKNGFLKGYNTDVEGIIEMITSNIDYPGGTSCLILGNGATSDSLKAVLSVIGCNVTVAARHPRSKNEKSVKNIKDNDYKFIFNTTPVGTKIEDDQLISLADFPSCKFYFDVIFSPYRTKTCLEAKKLGIGYCNGLSMLLKQARANCEIVKRSMITTKLWKTLSVLKVINKMNIVFVGMPFSGKTKLLNFCKADPNISDLFGPNFKYSDTDSLIEKEEGMAIKEIFELKGEEYFRQKEKELIKKICKSKSKGFISVGGGAILDDENYRYLAQTGYIVYLYRNKFDDIDFSKEKERPLGNSKEKLIALFKQRHQIYSDRSDLMVPYSNNELKIMEDIINAIIYS